VTVRPGCSLVRLPLPKASVDVTTDRREVTMRTGKHCLTPEAWDLSGQFAYRAGTGVTPWLFAKALD
jgi:hypothetical protein